VVLLGSGWGVHARQRQQQQAVTVTVMAKQPTTRKRARRINPQGRVDWMGMRLLEEAVGRKKDPMLTAAFEEVRGDLWALAQRYLGPRTRFGKHVKQTVVGIGQVREAYRLRQMQKQSASNLGGAA
jgi:hypothetical protein